MKEDNIKMGSIVAFEGSPSTGRGYCGWVFLALCFLPLTLCIAQVEHVQVQHPVYDFLDRMSVRGFLTGYSRAVLPLQRREVSAFLDSLSRYPERYSETERELLERYADEFVAEDRRTQLRSIFFRGEESIARKVSDLFSDKEKFLYAWRDSSTTFFVELLAGAEYRALISSGRKSNVTLAQIGGRFRGTVNGFLGYGLQATNGTEFGSRDFALTDRLLRQNANFGDYEKSFFDFSEAYISADFGWGRLVLGRERFLAGTGLETRLLVSDNAPVFDALRFEAHIGALRYLFLHSSVLDRRQILLNGQPYYDPKFMAMHRAEAHLGDAFIFGVFESVVYAKRYLDLAYLNPINFYKSAEHELGDRDNPMLGFDLQISPVGGVRVHGSWLIDDVDFAKWGTGWWGNKFAWQGGVTATALLPNTDVACEYTRIEPYTFSHFFSENAYTHKNYVIGPTLSPNSDSWFLSFRHWIGPRLILFGSYKHERHADNEYDAAGLLTRNHGGDALEGFVTGRDRDTARFLDGIRSTADIITLRATYEPFRNIRWILTYQNRTQTGKTSAVESAGHYVSLLLDIAY